jgi:hypothetical protein
MSNAPCGGRKFSEPGITVRAGVPFDVVLLKNLNHFNEAAPGNFTVQYAYGKAPEPTQFKTLAVIPDTSEPSGTIYQVRVHMPIPAAQANVVLQAKYMPNNGSAPPVFYQCADIVIQ